MGKKNPKDTLYGWLLIIAIFAISGFYVQFDLNFFLEIALVLITLFVFVGLFFFLKSKKSKKDEVESRENGAIYGVMEDNDGNQQLVKYNINDYPGEIPAFLARALEAESQEDYLTARVSYMQAADTLKNRCSKEEYEIYMPSLQNMYDEFVLRDPYYEKLMQPLLRIISENNGILQSEITKRFQSSDWGALTLYDRPVLKDDIYYALYFADRFGHVNRIKKGRSYLLYLPGTEPQKD